MRSQVSVERDVGGALGIVVDYDERQRPIVGAVRGPAAAAGLQPGDRLLEIDGVDLSVPRKVCECMAWCGMACMPWPARD